PDGDNHAGPLTDTASTDYGRASIDYERCLRSSADRAAAFLSGWSQARSLPVASIVVRRAVSRDRQRSCPVVNISIGQTITNLQRLVKVGLAGPGRGCGPAGDASVDGRRRDRVWLARRAGMMRPTTAVRDGRERGSVTLGGRRVAVTRPRVRAADGSGELSVPSYELFTSTEILGKMAIEKMHAGLTTRC
ncbi:MAG: putative transposase, partial [Mycobacterium sp.]|nr:putative transposase [Mycobacterium sp.]